MTKEEIKTRLFSIDVKMQELQLERDHLMTQLMQMQEQPPPDLGVKVSDGIGADDIVR